MQDWSIGSNLNCQFSYSAIWNNKGDEATLRNALGRVVDRCSYAGGGRDGAFARCLD